MTPKQQRFVAEYLIDLNATQAAIRAGYSAKTAGKKGPALVGNSRIAAAIEAGKKKLADEAGIDAAWVRRRLKFEAELTGEGSSHSARVAALALAAKIAGMITDNVKLSGRVGGGRPLFTLTEEQLRALTGEAEESLVGESAE